MAKGEKTWVGNGETVKRTFKPVPPREWEARLNTDSIEIAKKPEPGSFPYIKGVRFVCLGSAEQEGGRDRMIFWNCFVSLKPGKDGSLMPLYANGLLGLMKALGDVRLKMNHQEMLDEEGNLIAEYLDPKEVVEYLKSHNGDTLSLHSKIQKGTEGYSDQAVVDYFTEVEGSSFGEDEEAPEEDEEESSEEEPEEADEEAEEEEPEEEEAEEEEPPPPPKKAAKKLVSTKGKKR